MSPKAGNKTTMPWIIYNFIQSHTKKIIVYIVSFFYTIFLLEFLHGLSPEMVTFKCLNSHTHFWAH